jgi:spore coat polysaccharide biosynthesis protein SpsF
MGSTRLPGKVLAEIAGRPMLAWVLQRLARARHLDRVLVVTTCLPCDDELCAWMAANRLAFYRGSELDVLDRYYQAALALAADQVVRVTADCPFIDPQLVDNVLLHKQKTGADYVNNFAGKKYPLGLSVEAFTFEALRRAWLENTEPHEKAHVTPYFYLHPERFRVEHVAEPEENYGHLRWTVDMPEDLAAVRAICTTGGDAVFTMGWREILGVTGQNKKLENINRQVRQKSLQEL